MASAAHLSAQRSLATTIRCKPLAATCEQTFMRGDERITTDSIWGRQ